VKVQIWKSVLYRWNLKHRGRDQPVQENWGTGGAVEEATERKGV
jgi:hypothetical protein